MRTENSNENREHQKLNCQFKIPCKNENLSANTHVNNEIKYTQSHNTILMHIDLNYCVKT